MLSDLKLGLGDNDQMDKISLRVHEACSELQNQCLCLHESNVLLLLHFARYFLIVGMFSLVSTSIYYLGLQILECL